ncbi:MAG TPA: DNA-3-methyladenine glycosylase 2 family protein [Actinomycetota bacterium]|nr:DNA-3-methyladenine glycosylase 2 family protein [Actinomycetota bacterium]
MQPLVATPPPLLRTVRLRLPVDLSLSLGALRHGPADPTISIRGRTVWRATLTEDGPATLRLTADGDRTVAVEAWGPGARAALDRAHALCGGEDDLRDWEPGRLPLVADLDRRFRGLRLVSTGRVMEAAVPTVLEQKVTAVEAHRAWRSIVRAWGSSAPGPAGLMLPPSPEVLAVRTYHEFHRHGVERRRADVIRCLAGRAARVEEAAGLPGVLRRARLEAFPGVGPWTSAEVAAVAWGDPDAVPVGDYHAPGIVVYSLTGKRGGDDDAMMELLEPLRPHRGRAARLLVLGGGRPRPRGPKAPLRDFRRI